MRKFSYLLLALVLALPMALPFAPVAAQDGDPVAAALEAYNANLPAGYGNVSVEDLSIELLENPNLVLLDVRQPDEYEAGHIEGAFNVPLRELAQHLDLLPDLDAEIVTICGSGWRSSIAMTSLQILGYTNVRNMRGGMNAWNTEEFGTITDAFVPEAGAAPDLDAAVVAAIDAQLMGIPEGWGSVKAEDFFIELTEAAPDMLIDVRKADEWAAGYIEGAVLMPLEELMSFAADLPEDKAANIVIYCAAGHRGNMAATMVRTMGYTNVRNLSGGFGAWSSAEYPFTVPPAQGDPVMMALEAYNANLPAGYGNVSVEDLSIEILENSSLVLLDVRQPDEYEAGHIPGAFNVPLRELAQHLDLLPDTGAEIVTICGSGWRSSIAMTSLQILGYTNVRNMRGGMNAWNGEEFGTTTDAFVPEAGAMPALDAAVVAAIDAQLMGIPEGWGSVKAEDFFIELTEAAPDMLIDVRTPDEWAAGYIEGAVLMPLEELMSFAADLPEDKAANIVIYCAAGHRGNMAATMVRTMGYTNVRNLSGGFGAWSSAGYPAAMPEGAALDLPALLDAYITNLPASFNAIRVDDLVVELAEKPDMLLVDVRTADEYLGGHLAGAINIPLIELTDHLALLPDLNQEMVIYCGSGHRSAQAMTVLNVLGYANARSLLGGVKAWTGANLEITTDAVEATPGTAPAVDAALFELVDSYVKNIPAGYYTISADNLFTALIEEPPVIIDVRTPGEVEQGVIEGAIHIELRTFMQQMDKWPADKGETIVLYCGSDHRAVISLVAMQLMGYENVTSLAGGLQAWLAADYPVVQLEMAG